MRAEKYQFKPVSMPEAIEILELPPVEWQQVLDDMTGAERGELAECLAALASRAAYLSLYAEERHGAGCGDQGHKDASKAARKAQTAVRKALGFSYPNKGILKL